MLVLVLVLLLLGCNMVGGLLTVVKSWVVELCAGENLAADYLRVRQD